MTTKAAIVLLLLGARITLSLAVCADDNLDESKCEKPICFNRVKGPDGCRTCECDETPGQIIMSDIKTDEDSLAAANKAFGTDRGRESKSNDENIQSGASKAGTIRLWNTYNDGTKYLLPYRIDSSISSFMRGLILAAIADYDAMTCFRFVGRTSESNYIEFSNFDSGCWSYIGRRFPGNINTIQLANTGCGNKGVVIHEILHALGFWHEQSRPDRDDFVRIHWDNIIPAAKSQFIKLTTDDIDSLNVEYDVRSIMHYFSSIFSINGEDTITDLNNNSLPTQQNGFVESDLEQLRIMYGCVAIPVTTEPAPTPTEPTPAPTEPTPAPTEPTPAPTEPTPAPTEPTPAPTEPTPAPTEPTPAPTEPTPAPTEPTPAPTEPTPAPTEPTPAPTEPTPAPTEPTPAPTEPTPAPTEPTPAPTEPTTPPTEPPNCFDTGRNCARKVQGDKCRYKIRQMKRKCEDSCGFCGCEDAKSTRFCRRKQRRGQCWEHYDSCQLTCGMCGLACVDELDNYYNYYYGEYHTCEDVVDNDACDGEYGYLCRYSCGLCINRD